MELTDQQTWAGTLPPVVVSPVTAAKLSVLHLDPIKARLGSRWNRLSDLVHKLFEKALRDAQGPRDHYVSVGELSYIVTFHGLSPEEATVACVAVAKGVCKLLFGEDGEAASVSSIVGTVPGPLAEMWQEAAVQIASSLERDGTETVTTRKSEHADQLPSADQYWIDYVQQYAGQCGQKASVFPTWDLSKKRSQWLLLAADGDHTHGPCFLQNNLAEEEKAANLEIALLRAASAYGIKVQQSGQLCAIAVGVNFNTLSGFHSRMRYIQALKSVVISQSCLLLLKIECIPEGAVLGRIAEMIAMLSCPRIRVLLKFSNIRRVPPIDIRLGTAGIGTMLPERCGVEEARQVAQVLVRRASDQKAFAFIDGLASRSLVPPIFSAGVSYASGMGIPGDRILSLEVPRLPLTYCGN